MGLWFGGQGTRRGGEGREGRDDGLEGVDGKRVEELVGKNKGGFGWICNGKMSVSERGLGKGGSFEGFTVRDEPYIFTPRYRKIGVFTFASKANFNLLDRRISAQKFSLRVP